MSKKGFGGAGALFSIGILGAAGVAAYMLGKKKPEPVGQVDGATISLRIMDSEGIEVPHNSPTPLNAGATYTLQVIVTNTSTLSGVPAAADLYVDITNPTGAIDLLPDSSVKQSFAASQSLQFEHDFTVPANAVADAGSFSAIVYDPTHTTALTTAVVSQYTIVPTVVTTKSAVSVSSDINIGAGPVVIPAGSTTSVPIGYSPIIGETWKNTSTVALSGLIIITATKPGGAQVTMTSVTGTNPSTIQPNASITAEMGGLTCDATGTYTLDVKLVDNANPTTVLFTNTHTLVVQAAAPTIVYGATVSISV